MVAWWATLCVPVSPACQSTLPYVESWTRPSNVQLHATALSWFLSVWSYFWATFYPSTPDFQLARRLRFYYPLRGLSSGMKRPCNLTFISLKRRRYLPSQLLLSFIKLLHKVTYIDRSKFIVSVTQKSGKFRPDLNPLQGRISGRKGIGDWYRLKLCFFYLCFYY